MTVKVSPLTANAAATPHRALPPWAIDSLMKGAPLYAPAPKVWGKLVSVAMSAQRRGWTKIQFVDEVTRNERRVNAVGQRRRSTHKLWEQVQSYSRDSVDAFKELDKAWSTATDNLLPDGLRTPGDLIASAVERAFEWAERLEEGGDNLSDVEKAVMSYLIAEIQKRRMTRVTCPCRPVGEFAKVPHTTANRTLKRLVDRGFLVQFSKGKSSQDPAKRKAAIYELSDPSALRQGGRR